MGRKRWQGVSKKKRSEILSAASASRMTKLTPAQRKAIAKKAAEARWGKKDKAEK